MDMNDILKLALNSGVAEEIGKQTGISGSDAAGIMESVLPALLKGMQGQATNQATQKGFIQALADHSKDDTSDVQSFVKNVDTEDGDKIVTHLLGDEKAEVAAKAKKSGIDTKTVLKIMAIVAPLLMSQMGKKTESAAQAAKKTGTGEMLDIVSGLMDGVDAGDVIKILGAFIK